MSVIDDLQNGTANALDVPDEIAGVILAAAILVSVALVLAMAKMNQLGVIIVLISVLALTMIIGWMPYWVVILVILVTVSMFGKTITDWFTGTIPGFK